ACALANASALPTPLPPPNPTLSLNHCTRDPASFLGTPATTSRKVPDPGICPISLSTVRLNISAGVGNGRDFSGPRNLAMLPRRPTGRPPAPRRLPGGERPAGSGPACAHRASARDRDRGAVGITYSGYSDRPSPTIAIAPRVFIGATLAGLSRVPPRSRSLIGFSRVSIPANLAILLTRPTMPLL